MRVVGATTDVRVGVSLRVGVEVYTAGVISFVGAVGSNTSAWVVVTRAVDVCFSRSPIVHDYGAAGKICTLLDAVTALAVLVAVAVAVASTITVVVTVDVAVAIFPVEADASNGLIAIVVAGVLPAPAVDVDVVATGTPAFLAPVDLDAVDAIAITIAIAFAAPATAAAAAHVIAAATAALLVAAVVAAVIRIDAPTLLDPVVSPCCTCVAVFYVNAAVTAVVVVTVVAVIAGVVAVIDHPIAAVPAVANAAASVGTLLGLEAWVCVPHTDVDIGVGAVRWW